MDKVSEFIDKHRFLSNFYTHSPITVQGIDYPTSEHAYQALKSVDDNTRRWIASMRTPGHAKRAGRTIELRSDWEDVKLDVMRAILAEKFKVGTYMWQLLEETGDAELIEGNSWGDTFWGVDLRTGIGRNYLGQLLMERRRLNRAV